MAAPAAWTGTRDPSTPAVSSSRRPRFTHSHMLCWSAGALLHASFVFGLRLQARPVCWAWDPQVSWQGENHVAEPSRGPELLLRNGTGHLHTHSLEQA